MAPPLIDMADIVVYYSFIDPEIMNWPRWLTYSTYMIYPHKWSAVSCRSSAGQRKFAG